MTRSNASAPAPRPAAPPAADIEPPDPWPSWREKWTPLAIFKLVLYIGVCFMALTLLPNTIWDPELREVTYVIGILGIWRYSWWLNHAIRARIYGRRVYPSLREEADALWRSGWRPRHMHFLITTYREDRETTEAVIRGICQQIREAGVPGTIWLGSGDIVDEQIMARHLDLVASDLDITLRIVRQNVPGKRMAIALILRAMARAGVGGDDLVTFMDGDFVIAPGALRRCLPLFGLDSKLDALTTDEQVICRGPWWVQKWLAMRFAQRRIAMQSHALSKRVLTLTGRMSVFRARHITSYEFIRLLEADYLDDWLWGQFRFLSGDDKSTWYYILKQGGNMLYVPDATGYTIEIIEEGGAIRRMIENFRRWSGNMLRNGKRAIALGPHRMPFFIWWCLVDQRIAIWTMLVSPTLAISASILKTPAFIISYAIYIAVTRLMQAMFLYSNSREIDFHFPWMLYANQLLTASVKVYIFWRLSKQKWANRGNQRQGFGERSLKAIARDVMASYLTLLSIASLFLGVIIYTRLLEVPSWGMVYTIFTN